MLSRAAPSQAFQGGCIQLYDETHDCFIVSSGPGNAQYQAIQFKQFTVEQDAGQIVLRVPKCVHTALPQPYQDLCNEGIQLLHSEEAGEHHILTDAPCCLFFEEARTLLHSFALILLHFLWLCSQHFNMCKPPWSWKHNCAAFLLC